MKVFSPATALAIGAVFAASEIGQVDAAPCAALTDVQTATTITASGGIKAIEPTGADTTPCTGDGKHVYLSSLIIVPESGTAVTDLTVAFKFGDTATAISAEKGDCDLKYTDVGKSKTVTDSVKGTITCGKTDTDCSVKYKATYACYTKPAAYFVAGMTKTWRRKAATGAGCTPSADACFAVCSKGYAVTAATANSKVAVSLASQIKSDSCNCATAVTADAASDGLSATGTSVTFDYDGTDITVETTQSGGDKCKATYTEGAYNPFTTGKTYTRGTYDPSTCASATDCEFKCNAELALTVTNDKAVAKSADVASCTCADLTATVADNQATTVSTTASGVSYTLKPTANGFDLTTVKGSGGSAVTCKAPYTVKPSGGASSGSGSGSKSAPTSGVSVNTIWAVAATAVVAVAGAFVMV